jgi:hypothetical protein
MPAVISGRVPAPTAARSLGAPRTSYLLTVLAGALLVASTNGEHAGLLQRAGLGVTDAWMVVQALRQVRRVDPSNVTA